MFKTLNKAFNKIYEFSTRDRLIMIFEGFGLSLQNARSICSDHLKKKNEIHL